MCVFLITFFVVVLCFLFFSLNSRRWSEFRDVQTPHNKRKDGEKQTETYDGDEEDPEGYVEAVGFGDHAAEGGGFYFFGGCFPGFHFLGRGNGVRNRMYIKPSIRHLHCMHCCTKSSMLLHPHLLQTPLFLLAYHIIRCVSI